MQGIETYQNGLQHGYKEFRNENGLVNRGTYQDDKQDDFWEFFYENGQVSASENYENGVSQGLLVAYYEDGTKKREGNYLNGKRDGEWKYYYSNGAISAIGDYKEGNSTGVWKYYFDDGKLKSEGEEFADQKLRDWIFYHRNGNINTKEFYKEGIVHGPLFRYDSLGNFKSETLYINGVGQTFNNLYDSVDNLSLTGRFDLAEQTLEALEKKFEDDYEKNDLKKSDLYELIGVVALRKNEYKRAIKYTKKSLNNTLKHKDDTSSWYTSTLDDLADIYTANGDHEKAYEIYKDVIKKIEARPNGKQSDEYARSFRFYTIALMNLKRHDEAIELLHSDLNFRKSLPNQNKNTVTILYSIMDGHYPTLSSALDSTIAISESFHKENDIKNSWTYASTHYFKALVHRDRNELDSAYKYFKSSIQTTSNIKDTIDADFVNSLIHMGNYHYIKLEYDLSRPFYKRALALGENPVIQKSWIYSSLIDAVCNQFWADSDYPNTLKYNQLLADLAKKNSDNRRLGQAYSGMALAYDHMGRTFAKDAQEHHLKAIEVLSTLEGYSKDYINAQLHYVNSLNTNQQELEPLKLLNSIKNELLSYQKVDSFYLYRTYDRLANYYYDQYTYDSAIFYAEKITADLEQKPGRSLQQYLQSYRLLGDVLSSKELDEKASIYYFKALSETERYLGKENEFYLYALLEIADNFSSQSNPTSAILYYNQGIELAEKLQVSSAVLSSKIDLAEELIVQKEYEKALLELNHVLQSYENLDQTESSNYLWCLRIKSRVYERQDDIRSAEEYFLEGLDIASKMYTSDSRDYASYIRRLGQFYLRNNEPELAYQYVAPAIDIIEKTFGDEVLIYAWYAETMSDILYRLDNYAEAINLLEKAINIYKTQIGEEQDYIDAMYDLGQTLASIGQYEKSIEVLNKERQAVQKKSGRYSSSFVESTEEIASTYLLWEKNSEGLLELEKAKNIYDTIGVPRSYYASIYNFMGWALLDLDRWEEGKKYNELAIQIADSAWGKESGAAMTYRNNLAFFYFQNGDFAQAEKLWIETKDESFVSDLEKVNWLDNMATLYTSWGKLNNAEPYWDEINNLLLSAIKRDFPLLSEHGKAAFWDGYKKDFEIFNTYAIKAHFDGNKKAVGQMYDNQLQTKSLLLNSTTKERKRILNSGNKALLKTYNRYISLKEDLAKYYGYTNDQLANQSIDIAALESQAESLEKALSINSEDEKNSRNERNLTWKSIQRTLLPDEAAIEIIRFRHFDKITTDSVVYAALILTSETTDGPILEVLDNGNYLEDKAIKAYRSSMKFKVQDKRGYSSFWSSIDQHLSRIKNVYLSSDGVYHQLNVATLQKEDGSYINENYDIRLVSSTRTISELKKRIRTNKSQTAYIFGNPKFDLSHTLIEGDLRERGLTENRSYTRATTLDDFAFSELPGTKIETETVNEVLAQNQWATNLYLGENALEEELKRVDNPSILHIATHGFFLDQPDENSSDIQLGVQAEASRKNALLRSGLLMTGATQTAKGEQNNSIENGIFTAYEAMNLDLSSTELVILSACETGLGEIKNGEGVFGLQRAFQIAGAKSILMSLWKVDDDATQLLMTSFYDAWLKGADEATALHQAQEVVKAKYPHPNYWGAFVLVGG